MKHSDDIPHRALTVYHNASQEDSMCVTPLSLLWWTDWLPACSSQCVSIGRQSTQPHTWYTCTAQKDGVAWRPFGTNCTPPRCISTRLTGCQQSRTYDTDTWVRKTVNPQMVYQGYLAWLVCLHTLFPRRLTECQQSCTLWYRYMSKKDGESTDGVPGLSGVTCMPAHSLSKVPDMPEASWPRHLVVVRVIEVALGQTHLLIGQGVGVVEIDEFFHTAKLLCGVPPQCVFLVLHTQTDTSVINAIDTPIMMLIWPLLSVQRHVDWLID